MIAHVGGLPMEELLPLAYGAGAAWAAVRAWLALWRARARRRRDRSA